MNLVDRVKHITGVGMDLDVELPRTYLAPGDTLVYHVSLTSNLPVTVRTLSAEVVKGTAAPGTAGWGSEEAYCSAEPRTDIDLEEDLPYRFSGAIRLPDEIPLTVNDPAGATYWSLRVSADVPNGVDPETIVGFVVGPAHQFEWQVAEPIRVSVPGQVYAVTARGACTIVQPGAVVLEEIQAHVHQIITDALADLLDERPEFVSDLPSNPDLRQELTGALGEFVTPRVRASTSVPLDSVVELTVEVVDVKPQ